MERSRATTARQAIPLRKSRRTLNRALRLLRRRTGRIWSRKIPPRARRRLSRPAPRKYPGGPMKRRGFRPSWPRPVLRSARWAWPAAQKRCSRSTRRVASIAKAAPGRVRTSIGRSPSFARTVRKRSRTKRRRNELRRIFFASIRSRRFAGRAIIWLGQQGRLTHPMVKRADATHYEAIAWEDAFSLIAGELNALPTPNAAAFYTSGRTSNEAAFLVPTVRPAIRHEQPAGLLEHVPRVERRSVERGNRHRQRLRHAP